MKSFFKLPIKFRYILYVMLVINAILMTQDYINDSITQPQKSYAFYFSLIWVTSNFFIWAFLTPLIYPISQQFHRSTQFKFQTILKFILIGVLIAGVHVVLVQYFRYVMIFLRDFNWMNPFNNHSLPGIIFMTFSSFIQFFVIVAIFFAIDYYKRFQEKQNELNKAQLSALKMQLNPHFLFNTLHTISSLMGKNNQGQKVLSRLGDLLRSMLEGDQKMTITLEEEIGYIKSYLYIEEIRFQDRLTVKYDIEEGSFNCMVPNLILQPLVENSIKHGFAKKTDSGEIRIKSHIENNELILTVEDDGIGYKNGKSTNGNGIGVKNVKQRLNKMYDQQARFEIEAPNGQGCRARIYLPVHMAKKESKELGVDA